MVLEELLFVFWDWIESLKNLVFFLPYMRLICALYLPTMFVVLYFCLIYALLYLLFALMFWCLIFALYNKAKIRYKFVSYWTSIHLGLTIIGVEVPINYVQCCFTAGSSMFCCFVVAGNVYILHSALQQVGTIQWYNILTKINHITCYFTSNMIVLGNKYKFCIKKNVIKRNNIIHYFWFQFCWFPLMFKILIPILILFLIPVLLLLPYVWDFYSNSNSNLNSTVSLLCLRFWFQFWLLCFPLTFMDASLLHFRFHFLFIQFILPVVITIEHNRHADK